MVVVFQIYFHVNYACLTLIVSILHRTVSMAGCALFLTLLLYLSEALYFRTCNFDFYVIFPTILNCNYPLPRATHSKNVLI